ncbi:Purine nucleoside phosphorylase [Paramicrosporidium saccamoebae]|uniref:Purine nucleoside phosphorylase n=1 Tax=Paramicrosporidium saccamoebae TaxID=1246581 RepID=A0A2H9TPN4_9FUNG|nr:Purine nucleoside phosphorylase [Paramicrosporidium saccamoebae]
MVPQTNLVARKWDNDSNTMDVKLRNMKDAADYIRDAVPPEYKQPVVAIVCGSGLSSLASKMTKTVSIPYSKMDHFPTSKIAGHKNELVVGLLNNVVTVCLLGRIHYYEGHSLEDIVYPIRVLSLLGIKTVLVTNAAGGIDPTFQVGDLMVIEDHISFLSLAGHSPLRGENLPLGPRFPSMTSAYHPESYNLLQAAAEEAHVTGIKRGVYVGVGGPSFETPAEVRFLQCIGGSAVGMSTTPEVIAASHAGMNVIAFSLITNVAISQDERTKNVPKPTHEEVLQASCARSHDLEMLAHQLVPKLQHLQSDNQ